FGSAPKSVDAPEKIFERVASWTWVSSPMTISHCMAVCPCESEIARAAAGGRVEHRRPGLVVDAARHAAVGAVRVGQRDPARLLPDQQLAGAAVAGHQLDVRTGLRLPELGQVEAAAALAADRDLPRQGLDLVAANDQPCPLAKTVFLGL